jgi:CheY-like chemotaxis protein
MNQQRNIIDILLVEDSESDAFLTQESLRKSKIHNEIHIVTNGDEAMSYLRRQAPYQNSPRPDLVLLDLNLPRKSGREVLAEMKQDPELSAIPVVILTTSKAEEDIISSYKHHANCYVTKPVDLIQFAQVVQSIESFWFTIVKLPPNGKKK